MKNLVLGALFLFSVSFQAQTYVSYSPTSNLTGVATMNASINSDNTVSGSTYLFEDWNNSAKIYTDNGKVVNVENINFNASNAKFSFKISQDSIFTIYNIYKVEVMGKQFESIEDKFYEVLHKFEDNQMFLKEYVVKVKPDLHIITSTVIGPGKYVMEDEYYVYKDGVLETFWPSRKNVLNLLSSEKKLILKQAKNRKLSFSKEEDIVEIFEYYDTL